jgi:hypothetical protein
MAAATTASSELRLTTAHTVVRVSIATNVMISIINQQSKVLLPSELPSSQLSSSSSPPPMSTQLPRLRHACTPVLGAAVTTAHLLPRARSCRACDTRVPLFLGAADNSRQLTSEF